MLFKDTTRRGRGRRLRALARSFALAACWLAIHGGAAAGQPACAGDTNGDGMVGVQELIQCVNASLGNTSAAPPACDANGDGEVRVNELIQAVNNALATCETPAPPLPADAELIEGASRVAVTLPGTIEVIPIGYASASRGFADGPAGGVPAVCDTGGEAEPCATAGTRLASCSVSEGRSVLVEEFDGCVTGGTGETRSALDGRRVRTVDDPTFCDQCVVGDGVADRIELTDFALDFSCTSDCPPGVQDALLTTPAATVARTPVDRGSRAVITGQLRVENRATREVFMQTFAPEGLEVTQREVEPDLVEVEVQGRVGVADCLGNVKFTSVSEQPMLLRRDGKCPSEGLLTVALTERLDDGAAPAEFPEHGTGAGIASGSGFVDQGFRALNGQVYQVVQNRGGEDFFGAEDFRVNTAVGSQIELQPCLTLPTQDRPQVVAALGIEPFDPADVVTSGVIGDAGEPCFDPRGRGGDGLVCVGPGCTAACTCAGPRCRAFSIGDGASLAAGASGVPPAQLAEGSSLVSPCDFDSYATIGFGTAVPTTAAAQCMAEPADGILLRGNALDFAGGAPGATVIFGYPVPFGRNFVSGAGAFPIDRDNSNRSNCGAGSVIAPVRVSGNLDLVPTVRFRPTSVQFNFNADAVIDDEVESCEAPSLLRCAVTPAATPTPDPGCRATDIGNAVRRSGTTVQNRTGGASCGGGGNDAPDVVFSYKAPAAGFYVFDSAGSDFDTVLSIRAEAAGRCTGAEVACNDDRDAGTRTSEVGVLLGAGEIAVIVVDGFGAQRGNYVLNIRFAGANAPTPTPTPTFVPGGTAPDLAVTAVTAPETGTAGALIDVSALTTNLGGTADAFDLEIYFSTDAIVTVADIATGFGCFFGGLAPGASAECSGPIQVPATLAAGTYFVGAIADPRNQVAESDETNNPRASLMAIQIRSVATHTATPSATGTPPTPSATITSPAQTPTSTATATGTATATSGTTPSAPTSTSTVTATSTAMPSPSITGTIATPTRTRTSTRTRTATPTRTLTPTPTGPMNVVFARPVGVSVRSVPSAGHVLLAPGTEQPVTVTLLSTPAAASIAATVTTSDAAIADVAGAVLIGEGSRIAPLIIRAGTAGTATLRIAALGEIRDLEVTVGTPGEGEVPIFTAPPVGVAVRSVPSAGQAFLPPGTDQTITVTLLSGPAPGPTAVTAESGDPAVVAVLGAGSIAPGTRTTSLTVRAGSAGTTTVRLRAGDEVRDLSVSVGSIGGSPPAIAAPAVGASVRNVPSAGQVFVNPGQQRTVVVALLSAPAQAPLNVTTMSNAPGVAAVTAPVMIATGSRTASLPLQAGSEGVATLRLSAGGEIRDLAVIVGTPPGVDFPAVTAPVVGVQQQ